MLPAPVDKKTGVPILSLYDGKSGKPSEASMRKFDILVDLVLQDVGLRFYTYYASMCRLMDACAEYNRKVLILDRPIGTDTTWTARYWT